MHPKINTNKNAGQLPSHLPKPLSLFHHPTTPLTHLSLLLLLMSAEYLCSSGKAFFS